MEPPTDRTLFDEVGGAAAVQEIVDDFYRRVVADPQLGPMFERAHLARLRTMQTEFFGAALGGPVTYSGMALGEVHRGIGVTRDDFSRFASHLFETLEDRGYDQDLVRSVVGRLSVYVDDIVGGQGEDG